MVGYGELLGRTHTRSPRHSPWPQPHTGVCPSSLPARAPTASGTTPHRARSGLTWAPPCRDPLVSLPGEGGNGSEHKRSSLLQSSSTHSPCSKGQQGKREDRRVFMATIWAASSPLEGELGKPWHGNSSLSEGATELPGTWLLQAVPRKCCLSIFASYLEVSRLVSQLCQELM